MPSRKKAPDQKDSTGKLLRQYEGQISDTINICWLKGMGRPTVKLTETDQGATNALILNARVTIDVFVKIDLENTEKEYNGYTVLKQTPINPHLIHPIAENRSDFWIGPFLDAKHLYALAWDTSTRDFAIKVHNDFLEKIAKLWDASKTTDTRGNEYSKQAYTKRFSERYGKLLDLGFSRNTSIVVNGEDKGTLSQLQSRVLKRLQPLNIPFSVTAHRDEHPKNILIPTAGHHVNPAFWYLIDYVNTEKTSDWVFSIAKMLQGWWPYCPIELSKESYIDQSASLWGRFKHSNEKLEIEFDRRALKDYLLSNSYLPDRDSQMNAHTLSFARRFASAAHDNSWEERLKLALFLVIFGTLPFHFATANRLKYAVPLLMSESIKILEDSTDINDFCVY